MGGSDQWGNILAGLDLIQRIRGEDCEDGTSPLPNAFGITTPLLTTSSGEKFGKSAGNAIWLDPKLTSVFEFYQFFLKAVDADVDKYLRMLTLLPLDEIKTTMKEHQSFPEKRLAQRLLADEVTELIHGAEGVQKARSVTRALFENDLSKIRANEIISALSGDPCLVYCDEFDIIGQPLIALAANYRLASSRSEARRMADAKGLYLNNVPAPVALTVKPQDLIDGQLVIVRAGKDKHLVLAIR